MTAGAAREEDLRASQAEPVEPSTRSPATLLGGVWAARGWIWEIIRNVRDAARVGRGRLTCNRPADGATSHARGHQGAPTRATLLGGVLRVGALAGFGDSRSPFGLIVHRLFFSDERPDRTRDAHLFVSRRVIFPREQLGAARRFEINFLIF
jgi:hypothetical protein